MARGRDACQGCLREGAGAVGGKGGQVFERKWERGRCQGEVKDYQRMDLVQDDHR